MKFRLPELQPRERALAIGSGLVLLAVLLDRMVLNPWMRHARVVRQEIARMEDAISSHALLLARKAQVEAEVAQHQRYLRPAIPEELQTAALLKELEDLAAQSHIESPEIKLVSAEAEESAQEHVIEVKFECVPEEWLAFLYHVESSPSLFTVARAGLSLKADVADRLEGFLRVTSTSVRP
jgi:hypothetical protein